MRTLTVPCLVLLSALSGSAQVVNHESLASFDRIAPASLQAARDMRVLFMDRSVGVNTNDALNCLTATSYGTSANTCRKDRQFINGAWQTIIRTQADYDAGRLNPYIDYSPSPVTYNRGKFEYYSFYGTWDAMAKAFAQGIHYNALTVGLYPSGEPIVIRPLDYDVISFQFSYLNVTEVDGINAWFTHLPGPYDDAYDLERELNEHLTTQHFVYWTTSLARVIGTQVATTFNDNLRTWAALHGRPLFDFADIESHDMHGIPCYDNQSGAYPAICGSKTSEISGGHLSSAQGYISIAKGFWLMHSALAGAVIPPPDPTEAEALASFLFEWFASHGGSVSGVPPGPTVLNGYWYLLNLAESILARGTTP